MIRPDSKLVILLGVVGAEDLELADGPGVDLGERRVAVRGERPVIARPVLSGGVQGRRGRRLRRRRGRLVSRVQFRSRLPRRRSPRPDGVARQSDKELHLDWVGAVQQVTGQRARGKERNDPDRRDNQKFSVHSEVFTPRAASREAAETPWIPLLPSTSRLCAQNLRVAQRTTRSVCFGRLADNGLDPRNCEAKLGLRAQSPRVQDRSAGEATAPLGTGKKLFAGKLNIPHVSIGRGVVRQVQRERDILRSSRGRSAAVLLVADLLHPVDRLAVERSWMAMWVMAVVGAAPCQCFSPGAKETTSPGRISSIGPPRAAPGPSP